MKIELKKLSDLKPAPYNPRQSNAEQEKQLKSSLEKFGVVEPIIFNKQTGFIVGGHFRIRELKKLGYKEIECVIVDLNEADEKELNIRLNANTGSWDWDELANNWDSELLSDWGLEIPGFEPTILEAEEDDFNVPEGGIETDIVLGDLFEIGEHRLLCGDSTDSDSVAKLINNIEVDMIWTDPPYGINEKGDRSKRGGLAKGNNLPDFKDDTIQYAIDAFNQSFNLNIKEQVWFGANYYCHTLPQTANWLVWDKRVEEKQRDNNSDCELAWVKSKYSSIRIFRHLWKGMLKDSERGEKRVHATQKPIALVEYCINEYCPDAKYILDYFGGSGVCMVASHQLKKLCLTMEFEPHNCQVIIDRMKKLEPTIKIKRNGIELK